MSASICTKNLRSRIVAVAAVIKKRPTTEAATTDDGLTADVVNNVTGPETAAGVLGLGGSGTTADGDTNTDDGCFGMPPQRRKRARIDDAGDLVIVDSSSSDADGTRLGVGAAADGKKDEDEDEEGDEDTATSAADDFAEALAAARPPSEVATAAVLKRGTSKAGGALTAAVSAPPATPYELMYRFADNVPETPPVGYRFNADGSITGVSGKVYVFDPAAGTPLSSVFPYGKAPKRTFAAGDVLLLRRGYHGAVSISGVIAGGGTAYVTAAPGHTPLFRVLQLPATGTSGWDVGNLTVTPSATPPGHPDNAIKAAGVFAGNAADTSKTTYVTLRSLYVYSRQFKDTLTWTAKQWGSAGCPFEVNARYCAVLDCHVYNGGSLFVGYRCMPGLIRGCVHENFAGDGSGNRQGGVIWRGNFIYGSRKVDGNHNDLFQFWGGVNTPPLVYENNFLVTHPDWAQPFLDKPGVSDAQCVGCFDGIKVNARFANNVICGDHPIGLWLLDFGPTVGVLHNTIVQCGNKGLYFNGIPPCISLQNSKSYQATGKGNPASGAYVYNNLVHGPMGGPPKKAGGPPRYGYTGIAGAGGNAAFPKLTAPFTGVFAGWAARDLRVAGPKAVGAGVGVPIPVPPGLSPDAARAIAAPTTDIKGNPRVNADGVTIDAGAFSRGHPPSAWAMAPTAPYRRDVTAVVPFVVTGGTTPVQWYDIAWTALPGDKSFYVYVKGEVVGVVRTGRSVFAHMSATPVVLSDVTVSAVPTVSFLPSRA